MKIAGRAGFFTTSLMMLPGIAYLGLYFPYPVISLFHFIFSGQIFYETEYMIGGALNQTNLTKCCFLAFYFFGIITIYMLPVRWLCNKEDKKAFLAFRICLFMYLVPLSLLTFALHSLVLYIGDKGVTSGRFYGLVFIIAIYIAISITFTSWRIFRYLLMLLLLLFSVFCLICYAHDPRFFGSMMLFAGCASAISFCVLVWNLFRKKNMETNNEKEGL